MLDGNLYYINKREKELDMQDAIDEQNKIIEEKKFIFDQLEELIGTIKEEGYEVPDYIEQITLKADKEYSDELDKLNPMDYD